MRLRYLAVAFIVLADQFLVFIASNILAGRLLIVDDIAKFRAVYNYNWAFDFGRSPQWLIVCISLVTMVIIAYALFKSSGKLLSLGLALLLGGVISTCIDRLSRGKVVDYLNIGHNTLYFNLSDVAGFAGLIIVAAYTSRYLYLKADSLD